MPGRSLVAHPDRRPNRSSSPIATTTRPTGLSTPGAAFGSPGSAAYQQQPQLPPPAHRTRPVVHPRLSMYSLSGFSPVPTAIASSDSVSRAAIPPGGSRSTTGRTPSGSWMDPGRPQSWFRGWADANGRSAFSTARGQVHASHSQQESPPVQALASFPIRSWRLLQCKVAVNRAHLLMLF